MQERPGQHKNGPGSINNSSFVLFCRVAMPDDVDRPPVAPVPAFDDLSSIYGDETSMWDDFSLSPPPPSHSATEIP